LWVLGIHIGTMPDKPVTISMVNGNHSQVSATTIAPSAVSGLAISECSGSPIVASARCDGQPRPGLRRRFLGPGAHAMATGFGIEHKVQVVTMLSKTTLAKGSCSAEALASDTGPAHPRSYFSPIGVAPRGIDCANVVDRRPVERQVLA
jgi:hypothetical protein